MKCWIRSFSLAGLIAIGGAASSQTWNFVKVDPKSTYLRDSQFAPTPTVVQFTQLRPTWRFLEIRTVGWFNRAADNMASHNVSNEAVAVFSETGNVDPDWTRRERVNQAVDGGSDFYTLPTWVGNQATDIAEDFGLGPEVSTVGIPVGANFLMFTPYDNGFWNNCDDFSMPNADARGFGVEWRVIESVPEPATWAVLGLGLFGRRFRRRSN